MLEIENILFPTVWTAEKVAQYKYVRHQLICTLTFKRTACVFFCKLRRALRINESNELLKNRYFSDDDVKAWFYNNPINAINQLYVQKVKKSSRNKSNLQEILSNHPLYSQPQNVRLVHKTNRSLKCHGRCCKAIISVGTFCLKVKRSLTVPLNRNDAVQEDFYLCPHKVCLSSMPIWSNVRYPNSVDADAGIADSYKDNVAKDLGTAVI